MIRYRDCKIFRVENRDKEIATVDIETTSSLNIFSSFEDDRIKEYKQMTAFTFNTEILLNETGYNVLVPNVGEFKITSFFRKQINAGHFKVRYNYQWTLEG